MRSKGRVRRISFLTLDFTVDCTNCDKRREKEGEGEGEGRRRGEKNEIFPLLMPRRVWECPNT